MRQQIWQIGLMVFFASSGIACFPRLSVAQTTLNALESPARSPRIQDIWRQVYQQVPDLPLENQYVNRETGKVDPNNTFVSRLIRYHYYIKGRPVNYRLDWKFTLADFLGLNDEIEPATYPGADNLRTNPLEGDRAVIQRLNRKQRNALMQAIVSTLTPPERSTSATPAPTPAPQSSPTQTPSRPATGGARLLMP